jgi:transposase InsO family protein
MQLAEKILLQIRDGFREVNQLRKEVSLINQLIEMLAIALQNVLWLISHPGDFFHSTENIKIDSQVKQLSLHTKIVRERIKNLNKEAKDIKNLISPPKLDNPTISGNDEDECKGEIPLAYKRTSKGRQKLTPQATIKKYESDIDHWKNQAKKAEKKLEIVEKKFFRLQKKAFQIARREASLELLTPLSTQPKQDDSANWAPFDPENEGELFANAPEWKRSYAMKYLRLIEDTQGLNKKETLNFIAKYNQDNPDHPTSYASLCRNRKKYEEGGILALFPKWTNKITGKIQDEWMQLFESLYLSQNRPSAFSCWVKVMGKYGNNNPANFPCLDTFLKQLRETKGQSAIDYARLGYQKWNRKYNHYIERDYGNVKAGEVWVSDHNQIDVATDVNGKAVFVWQTVWRDFKSGKWLSWFIHPDPPNTDHILHSFFIASKKYGIPSDIYIDNGKDYRCKDFAGGRKVIKLEVEKTKFGVLAPLGIKVHFAIPYNAQSKPIERDFRDFKDWFSRTLPGFRGGNPVEKPEQLAEQIKTKKILAFAEVEAIAELFIEEIYNNKPISRFNNKTPNQIWNEEAKIRKVSPEALKLCCMRTSKPKKIGRNGYEDYQLGLTYWAEWMDAYRGSAVYIRRDPSDYGVAYVFDARTDEFLGSATVGNWSAPAMAKTPLEKQQLTDVMKRKQQHHKMIKEIAKTADSPDAIEQIMLMSAGMQAVAGLNGSGDSAIEPNNVITIVPTPFDDVARQEKDNESRDQCSIARLLPKEEPKQKEIFVWGYQKRLKEKEREAKDDKE